MKLQTIYLTALLTIQINPCAGQIWPFSLSRFVNTTYINIETLVDNDFQIDRLLLGKGINNSFVDTQLKTDSLVLDLNGELVTFYQNKSKSIKNNSSRLFYSRRPLITKNNHPSISKIDYIKVINANSDSIDIELNIKSINNDGKHSKHKIKSTIANKDIDGLFIGPGKQYRIWTNTLAGLILLGLVIL